MGTPFFQGFERQDLYTLAVMAAACNDNSIEDALAAAATVEPVVGSKTYTFGALTPQAFVIWTDSFLFVLVAGTQNPQQWALNILGSLQASDPPVPGSVADGFAGEANVIGPAIKADVIRLASGRSVVYCGHSLGGAIVQLLYQTFIGSLTSPTVIFTFGCPRVGDPIYAAAFGISTLWRVENSDDPIPSVPPPTWGGLPAAWPLPGPPLVVTYEHAGNASTLDPQGNLTPGHDEGFLGDIYNAINGRSIVTPHRATEYARRLRLLLPEPPPPPEPPPALQPLDGSLADITTDPANWGTISLGGKAVAAQAQCKVQIFYVQTQDDPPTGFSEVWYSASDVNTLANTIIPNYVQARMTLATSNLRAVYARISQLGKPRQINFWIPASVGIGLIKGPQVPVYVGQYAGPDVEQDLAVLLRVQNTAGFWTRMFLHNFPAEIMIGGRYSATVAWSQVLSGFIQFLTVQNPQILFRSYSGSTIQTRQLIQSIAGLYPRGMQVTPVAGATMPPIGSVIYVGGCGRQEYGMNGRKIVTTNNAAQVGPPAVPASFNVGGATPVGSLSTGQPYYQILPVNDWGVQAAKVERITHRRVGKPVFEPAGRRRNQLALAR